MGLLPSARDQAHRPLDPEMVALAALGLLWAVWTLAVTAPVVAIFIGGAAAPALWRRRARIVPFLVRWCGTPIPFGEKGITASILPGRTRRA